MTCPKSATSSSRRVFSSLLSHMLYKVLQGILRTSYSQLFRRENTNTRQILDTKKQYFSKKILNSLFAWKILGLILVLVSKSETEKKQVNISSSKPQKHDADKDHCQRPNLRSIITKSRQYLREKSVFGPVVHCLTRI